MTAQQVQDDTRDTGQQLQQQPLEAAAPFNCTAMPTSPSPTFDAQHVIVPKTTSVSMPARPYAGATAAVAASAGALFRPHMPVGFADDMKR